MKIINLDLTLNTKPKSLIDITFDVSQHVQNSKILNGLCSLYICLLYTSPSPRDKHRSRMPSSA